MSLGLHLGGFKMKYKQKPIEVEVFRFGYDPIPDWFKIAEDTVLGIKYLGVKCSGGLLKAHKGDYVIKDSEGFIYPCSAAAFEVVFGR